MTIRLGSFANAERAADFDPETGRLGGEFDLRTMPVEPLRGSYDRLGSTPVVLYVAPPARPLFLNVGGRSFVFNDDLRIIWQLVGAEQTDLMWHLRPDGEAELTVESPDDKITIRYRSGPSDTLPLALDTSACVEYEDFDFGLYLANMREKRSFEAYARAAAS